MTDENNMKTDLAGELQAAAEKTSAPSFTAEQKRVIEAPSGNLLVSAAAGSGKTLVMTERLLKRILDGDVSLDRCLVLTFTNAASESMERKIRKKLDEKAAEAAAEGNTQVTELLERQSLALQRAHISTIHAFCLWLIQNFPHEVKDGNGEALLDADFATLDEKAADELRDRALAETMAEAYKRAEEKAPGSEHFLRLLDHYSGTKSDKALRELILDIHDFLRSLPDYEAYTEKLKADLSLYAADFTRSPHMKYILRELRMRLQLALADLDQPEDPEVGPGLAARLSGIRFIKDPAKNMAYHNMFLAWFEAARECDRILTAWEKDGGPFTAWDDIWRLARSLEWKKPVVRATDSPAKADFIRDFCEAFADFILMLGEGNSALEELASFPVLPIWLETIEQIESGIKSTEPCVQCFLDLVLATDRRYQTLKSQRRGVDFSDYEHFALKILRGDDGLRFCRSQFTEVFVDEYQDTSSLQETILSIICPDNLFMVGDVKQSIYRFRHAKPENFLAKARLFQNDPAKGRYLTLNKNFRSQQGILQGINEVFARVMTEAFSGINYAGVSGAPEQGQPAAAPAAEGHAMVPGREGEGDRLPERVELCLQLMDTTRKSLGEYLTVEEYDLLQARLTKAAGGYAAWHFLEADTKRRMYFMIGMKILRLHREENVAFKDIAVMARSNSACDEAAQVFSRMGIPQNRAQTAGMTNSYPMQLQLALLQTLDNVRQDIPLATLMLSGLLPEPFKESELLRIRVREQKAGRRGGFYDAVAYNAGEQDELGEKCRRFLETLESWRQRERHLTVKALLNEIWHACDYRAKLLASEGEEGLAVLEAFGEELGELERQGRYALHAVVAYYEEELEKQEQESAENDFEGSGVQILTFHKSKGLQFDHVFLLDLSSQLKDRDISRRLIISEELGLGFDIMSENGRYTYPSLLRLAMEGEKHQRYLTEEICLLYVAMSRAKEKLYLNFRFRPTQDKTRLSKHQRFIRRESTAARSLAHKSYLLQAIETYHDMVLLGLNALPYPPVREFMTQNLFPQKLNRYQREAAAQQAPEDREDLAWKTETVTDLPDYAAALNIFLLDRADKEARPDSGSAAEGEIRIEGDLYDFYRFEGDFPPLPKQTVSEVKRQSQEISALQEEGGSEINLNVLTLDEVSEGGEEGNGLTAAEQGTALHTALRFLDLKALALTEKGAAREAAVEAGLREMAAANLLDELSFRACRRFIPQLALFTASPLADDIRAAEASGHVFRELPFTFRYQGEKGDSLIQGMIDLWYEKDGEITLVDFKSDRVGGSAEEAAAVFRARYRTQLSLYAKALAQSLGRPVSRAVIWSIRRGEACDFIPETL